MHLKHQYFQVMAHIIHIDLVQSIHPIVSMQNFQNGGNEYTHLAYEGIRALMMKKVENGGNTFMSYGMTQ